MHQKETEGERNPHFLSSFMCSSIQMHLPEGSSIYLLLPFMFLKTISGGTHGEGKLKKKLIWVCLSRNCFFTHEILDNWRGTLENA